MRLAFAILLLLTCATQAVAADLAVTLDQLGFVPGQSEPMCIEPSYAAEIVGERLSIRKVTAADERFAIDRDQVAFAGKLFRYESEDRGEFGGKLEVIGRDGKRHEILQGNVRSLLPVDGDLYVFEGLAHLSPTGSVYAIRKFDAEPRLERVTLLTDTPVFATFVQRARGQHWFWIVGTSSLTELIDGEFSVLRIHPFDDIHVSNFATLAELDDGVVIGTCGGVIAVQLKCPFADRDQCKPRFFVPKVAPR